MQDTPENSTENKKFPSKWAEPDRPDRKSAWVGFLAKLRQTPEPRTVSRQGEAWPARNSEMAKHENWAMFSQRSSALDVSRKLYRG